MCHFLHLRKFSVIKRIGFACKISQLDSRGEIKSKPELNFKSTTVAWLNRQSRVTAAEKLWDLMKYNIEAARLAVTHVGNLPESLRCFRLGSDILPAYTESSWSWFWKQPDVIEYAQRQFARVGQTARERDVRLSFHPGQFCCIVSESPDVVARSLEELEYHADMVRWMGYGQTRLDFKINIHLSGRLGVDAFDAAWNRMTPELRNCLTLENDEYQQGLDNLLRLKHRVAIVLDIHHHLIRESQYIGADDARISQIIDSWAGVRPIIHYSQSRDEHIGQFADTMPTMEQMLTVTNRSKLRAHSNAYTNTAINKWALAHLEWADIMAESKWKDIAAHSLYNQYLGLNS